MTHPLRSHSSTVDDDGDDDYYQARRKLGDISRCKYIHTYTHTEYSIIDGTKNIGLSQTVSICKNNFFFEDSLEDLSNVHAVVHYSYSPIRNNKCCTWRIILVVKIKLRMRDTQTAFAQIA